MLTNTVILQENALLLILTAEKATKAQLPAKSLSLSKVVWFVKERLAEDLIESEQQLPKSPCYPSFLRGAYWRRAVGLKYQEKATNPRRILYGPLGA